jgi:mannose-1-phosphate guanylyltransferase
MYAVIMAGGSGERFWPSSRKNYPKQLLKIIGKSSMLQMTIDRLSKIKAIKDIYIVTRQDLVNVIKKNVTGIRSENIIVEPSAKNTAPCIGLSAIKIRQKNPDAVMAIFPADHLIVGHRHFNSALSTANHLARKKSSLVTLGVIPTYPATGYGYIQYDKKSDVDHMDAYRVKVFAEKPHLSLAKRFMQSGDFLWNSGIFIWKVKSFMDQIQNHMPDLYDHLEKIDKLVKQRKNFRDLWEDITPESVDYGLMEKAQAQDVYVIKAKFEWNDLGSWNSVYDVLSKLKDGNVIKGDGVVIKGKNNLIQSEDHFTAILGLDDITVINTKDATLVIPKSDVEEVKLLVEWLKKKKIIDLL